MRKIAATELGFDNAVGTPLPISKANKNVVIC